MVALKYERVTFEGLNTVDNMKRFVVTPEFRVGSGSYRPIAASHRNFPCALDACRKWITINDLETVGVPVLALEFGVVEDSMRAPIGVVRDSR